MLCGVSVYTVCSPHDHVSVHSITTICGIKTSFQLACTSENPRASLALACKEDLRKEEDLRGDALEMLSKNVHLTNAWICVEYLFRVYRLCLTHDPHSRPAISYFRDLAFQQLQALGDDWGEGVALVLARRGPEGKGGSSKEARRKGEEASAEVETSLGTG